MYAIIPYLLRKNVLVMYSDKLSREVFRCWEQEPPSPEVFQSWPELQQIQYWIQCAHVAASSHNTQPWYVQWNQETQTVHVFLDHTWILPESDKYARQATISMGCFAYNLECSARYYGWELQPTNHIPDQWPAALWEIPGKSEIISYRIKGKTSANNNLKPYVHAMYSRRVNRGEYDSGPTLPVELVQELKQIAAPGVNIELITDRARIFMLAELQGMADQFVINHKRFAREFILDWILENDSESGRGMPGNTFGLEDALVKRIRQRMQEQSALDASDVSGMVSQGKRGLLSSKGVVMIVSKDNQPVSWFIAGKLLQEALLRLEIAGMATSIHAGLAEVEQVNKLALRPLMLIGKRPLILFRFGFLKSFEARAPHAPRIPMHECFEVIS